MTDHVSTVTLDRLDNGAIVLARQQIAQGGNGLQAAEIVLCHIGNTVTPYVTWRRNIPEQGGDGSTYWGHYHHDLKSAQADYKKRIA